MSQPVAGTTTSEDEDTGQIEEIVVIGSRLHRRDFTAPSPITTVDSREIDLSGATSLDEILNTIPQVVPDVGRTGNNPQGSTAIAVSAINLRGLGANRTLVMVNGRRFSPAVASGAVDINVIPADLVEKVEVVTGGASAVYGSDAMAGVVNFVLKKNLDGVQMGTQFDVTEKGDGETYNVDAIFGRSFSQGAGNVTGFFNFLDRTPIRQGDRGFSAVALAVGPDGKLRPAGSSITPAGVIAYPPAVIDGTPVSEVTFNPDGTPRPFRVPGDLYNYAPDNYLQVPLERYAGGAFLNYDFTRDISGFVEFLFARNDVGLQLAPVPFGDFVVTNVDNPLLSPAAQTLFSNNYDPNGDGNAEFALFRRLEELGPRQKDIRRDTYRLVAGLNGKLLNDVEWQIFYSYNRTASRIAYFNDAAYSRFQQALLVDPVTGACLDPSGGCVPANVFGEGNITPEAADFLRQDNLTNRENISEHMAQADISAPLFDLPAGPVEFAGGFEWRQLKIGTQVDNFQESLGFGGDLTALAGTVDVKEGFAELLVPLLQGKPLAEYVGLETGARVSAYNLSGTVWTWKAGAQWRPVPDLLIRAMYQHAVRAPNGFELFDSPETIFFVGSYEEDSCLARNNPVGQGIADICVAQGMDPAQVGVFDDQYSPTTVTIGGNPNLDPETGKTLTIGGVFKPSRFPGMSIAVDYYRVRIEGAIHDFGPDNLPLCFVTRDPNSSLCRSIMRDPSGHIIRAISLPMNISEQEVSGLDLQVRHVFALPAWAQIAEHTADLSIAALASWSFENGGRAVPGAPFLDCAGYFGPECAVSSFGTLPDIKSSIRFTYGSGPVELSLRWRIVGGMKNSWPKASRTLGLPEIPIAVHSVGPEHYLDLSFGYDLCSYVRLRGGISNLLDNAPPLLGTGTVEANTDPATYDPFGRSFYLGLKVVFDWNDLK